MLTLFVISATIIIQLHHGTLRFSVCLNAFAFPKYLHVSGGVFRLYMKFNEFYNERPPDVCFHSVPFHPNSEFVFLQPFGFYFTIVGELFTESKRQLK